MKTFHARKRGRPNLRATLRYQVVRRAGDGGPVIAEDLARYATAADARATLEAWIAADRPGEWSELRPVQD